MEQHSGGPGTNRTTTDGVSLGGQFRFKPQALATPHSGGYVFGLARAGVESADQYRTVAVNGYFRTAKSNWLSPMATASERKRLIRSSRWESSGRSDLMATSRSSMAVGQDKAVVRHHEAAAGMPAADGLGGAVAFA